MNGATQLRSFDAQQVFHSQLERRLISFRFFSDPLMGESCPIVPRIGHPGNRLEKIIGFSGPNGLTAVLAWLKSIARVTRKGWRAGDDFDRLLLSSRTGFEFGGASY